MALNAKGEYSNYWGPQPEDLIFGGSTTALDGIMSLNRFKVLRRCLSFNVVNMNNYYTSVQPLQELPVKGIYGWGTIRANSKHYRGHTLLGKDHDSCVRGDLRQAVSTEHNLVLVSWCDGNIAIVVSNADASTMPSVTRVGGNQDVEFPTPTCVPRYNQNIQGDDRLGQLKGRF